MRLEKWLRRNIENTAASIKARPYTWGFCLLIVFILIPLILWLCYYIGDCGFVLIRTSLTIDGLLGFYGSFLAFSGTAALGVLAFWQNRQYQAENKRLNKMLFEAQIFSNCAFFKTESCKIMFYEEAEQFRLNIYFRNIGKSTAVFAMPYDLEFSKYEFKTGEASDKIAIQSPGQAETNILPEKLLCIASQSFKYRILNDEDYFAHITISIVSENQAQYDQEIQLRFKCINNKLTYVNEYSSKFLRLYKD